MTDNTSVTAQFGAGEREEKTKLVYVKRWRTVVRLPEQYADEIVEALRAAPVSHTSVKDGGGDATAWRVCWVSFNTSRTELFEDRAAAARKATETGGCIIPLGNIPYASAPPTGSDAVADGARELADLLSAVKRCDSYANPESSLPAKMLAYEAALRSAPVKAVGSEALRLLAAEDARQEKLHELLETIREQIRLGIEPEHRPEGLFQNIQDAVYAMRGRTLLMNDVAITSALAHPGSGDNKALVQELQRQVVAHERLQARIAEALGRETWRGDLADAVAELVGVSAPAQGGEVVAWRETAASWLERKAEIAINSLHCGDSSMTIHSTHRYAAGLMVLAKEMREAALSIEPQRAESAAPE